VTDPATPLTEEPTIWAAGGVVHRYRPKWGIQYLLVHRPRYDDWSLPKGKLNDGESMADAALRETREETGYRCALGTEVGTIAYRTTAANHKAVRYWLMQSEGGRFRRNAEVDTVEWVGFEAARHLLSYPRDLAVLERGHALTSNPGASRLFLLRHANAGVRAKWDGPDKKRPLTKLGRNQAEAITQELTEFPVTRVVTGPALRCRQTVEPLATVIGVSVEREDAFGEGAKPKRVLRWLQGQKGQSVVAATHGDVIENVIRPLSGSGVRLKGRLRWPKASVWMFDVVDGAVVSGRYLAPPT
jgi:8-oxo-dGTP diphosphatase